MNGTVNAILAGTSPLNKTTSDTVTLSGNNTYTGLTNITAGRLFLSSTGSIANGSNVTVNGTTAVLDLGSNHATDTVGIVTLQNGGFINGTGSSALGSTTEFDLMNGTVNAILTGTSPLNKTTTDTVTLSATNTYTGLTNVTAGTLFLTSSGSIASGSNVTVNGTTAVLELGSNHATDTVGIVTLQNGGVINGTGSSALNSTTEFDVMNGTVNAILTGSSPLNKTTNDTVTLSATNTYTGLTNITAGTLFLTSSGSIASGSNVTINGTTAVLDLGANHATDTVGVVTLQNGGMINGTGSSALASSTTSFDVMNGTVNAILTGDAPLNKTTNDTVTLSATNTYTGNTTITEGTLLLSSTGSIGSGSNVTVNGSTAVLELGANHSLDTVGIVTLDNGGLINGTGSSALASTTSFEVKSGIVNAILAGAEIPLNKTTNGTVTLTGANTYTGPTNITAGTLVVNGTWAAAQVVSVSTGSTLTLNNNNTITTLNIGGTLNSTNNSTLTATGNLAYNLTESAQINSPLGSGNLLSNGNVGINAHLDSTNISIATGNMTLQAPDLLNHNATVDIALNANLVLTNGDATISTLEGNGNVTQNNFVLNVLTGGSYNGTANSTGSLDVGNTGSNSTSNLTLNDGSNSTFANGTDVNSGNLIVNGNLTTPNVTVNPGGLLGGSGNISGNVTDNGGTTSPGNSPGILHVAGNYVENGTLIIQIGGDSGAGVNPSGNDQVQVGGTTFINPAGSTLSLQNFNSFFTATPGQAYKFISGAPGSITGHFGSVNQNFTNLLLIDMSTGEVIATSQPAGASVNSAFPTANANQLNMLNNLLVGPDQFVGGDLVSLLLQNPGKQAQIFNQSSPEAYAGLVDYALRITRSYTDAAMNMSPLAASGRFALFAGYNNYSGGSDSSQNQADYKLESNGAVAGARLDAGHNIVLGAFTGYSSGSVDSTYLHSNVTGNVYGAFVTLDPLASHRLMAKASFAYGDYDTHGTRATFSGVSSFPKVNSHDYQGTLGVQYVAIQQPKYSIAPELDVAFSSAKVDSITETNFGDVQQALQVNGQNKDSIRLEAAVNGAYAITSQIDFTGRVGVGHDFEKASRDVTANVVGETTPFTVRAPGMGDTDYIIGVGLNYNVTKALRLNVNYEAGFSPDSTISNTINVGVSFSF